MGLDNQDLMATRGNSDNDSGSDEAGDANGKGIAVARRFNPTRRKALILSAILLLLGTDAKLNAFISNTAGLGRRC